MLLKKIYREWRALFWGVLIFMLAQVFFMAEGIENIPFFLYHMYSKVHKPMDSIGVYLIKTPDGYFNVKQLSNREEELLMNSVSYYVNLKQSGDGIVQSIDKRFRSSASPGVYQYLRDHLYNDSTMLEEFPRWWSRYFRSVTGSRGDVSVVRSYVYAKEPYAKSENDSLVFSVNLK